MRSVLLVSLVVVTGCAGTAPALVPTPPPAVSEAPAPAPRPIPVDIEVPEPAPAVPPAVLERRIDRRAVYEEAQATEWVLANGLTVVYVQDPSADGYRVRVRAAGGWAALPEAAAARYVGVGHASWGDLRAEVGPDVRQAVGESDRLGDLVGDVAALFTDPPSVVVVAAPLDALSPRRGITARPDVEPEAARAALADAFDQPSAFVVVLSGSVGPEWVEPLVAERLAVRGRGARFGPLLESPPPAPADVAVQGPEAGYVVEADVAGEWADLAALRVLEQALAERAGPTAHVTVDLGPDRARLRVVAPGAVQDVWRPFDDAALRAARSRAARQAETPAGRLRAFADLYEQAGRYRPARNPIEAARLGDAIERTPPDRVAAWLRRFAASPDAARLTVLPASDLP